MTGKARGKETGLEGIGWLFLRALALTCLHRRLAPMRQVVFPFALNAVTECWVEKKKSTGSITCCPG
jgi:hypothetical protein